MDLTLSESELAFQAEARAWLEANVPTEPLPSMDTADGFVAHQEWERRLSDARWSVVSWPTAYHRPRGVAGRVGDLRGGVLPRRRARPGLPERHLPARADHLRPRHPGAAGPLPADDGDRRAGLGAVLVRARGRLRPGLAALDRDAATTSAAAGCSTARRPGRRGRPSPTGASGCSAPTPRRQRHHGLTYFLFPLDADGRHRAPDRPARRRGRLRRGLLRGRLRPGRRRARRPRRRLAGRDEHGRQRARPVAALPRPLLRRRRPARRPLPGTATRPRRVRRRRRRRLDQGAGLPALHVGHRHPARRRRRDGRGRLGQQGLLVRARHRAARDRARPARPRGRGRVALARRLHVLAVRPDLRRHQRDPAQHRRRADPRPAPRAQGRQQEAE